ncbi:hypothetical protein [Flavobacterium terrisoli]|uniref:hypothetical protein n=1 Tax=Flavobacterium terrisoli TaxID=3242195 RepID=UPI0025428FBA|nr:hypothetical protein [Flavobacterium buctense]
MKAKTTFFSMALLIAFLLLGCSSDDENTNFSSSSSVPQAPSGAKTQYFSMGSTVSDIRVEGLNIKWYLKRDEVTTDTDEANDSDELNTFVTMVQVPLDSEIKTGTTYYATQTINNVESRNFLGVTVYVFER